MREYALRDNISVTIVRASNAGKTDSSGFLCARGQSLNSARCCCAVEVVVPHEGDYSRGNELLTK